MLTSKCIAIAIAILFSLSAIPIANAASSAILPASQVQLNGPRVSKVIFTIIPSDSTLYNSLSSGAIQGPEWTFSTGSFASAQTNPNLYTNSTLGYTTDGIAFNDVRPVTNTTAFRRAMAYLTDYSFIESTVLSGVAGIAAPDVYPCQAYPSVCNPSIEVYPYSLNNAVKELKLSGLTEGNTTDVPLASITWLYQGKAWSPNFFYRSDDPLRTGVAQQLISAAQKIGLVMNAQGITHAGGPIYGAALTGAISPGSYNPATGYNNPPVFNYTAAQTTDTWDMYTYGWILTSNYDAYYDFFNTQFVGTTLNFLNYYNRTMDYYTNQLNYGSSLATVQAAGKEVALISSQQLPYLVSFYQNELYSVYINGWAGYANVATSGPVETTGLYYTLLNVHPAGQSSGGVFNLALHATADAGGMNPLYNTNWVWQVDVWSEVYDTPLATPPTEPNVALAYLPYMVNNYSITPFTGSTGTGAGWFQMQGTQTAHKISSGMYITYNLDQNLTWTDHVPLTAADYNYSLWAWAVSLPPSLPDAVTPLAGTGAGPAGMWATYIPPNNPYQIQIYFNSSSVWNLPTSIVNVLPAHIFKYFDQDQIATATGAMDTTQPFPTATSSAACGSPCSYLPKTGTVPMWVQDLPNLYVGSGPFWLRTFNPATGNGELDANVNYFRSAWASTAPTVTQGTSYTFSTDIQEWIYNAGTAAMSGVNPGNTGAVPITNATGTVTVYGPNGAKVTTANLAGGTGGVYTAAINTAGWAAGTYKLVTSATYNFLGLGRTWWQATGLAVTTPVVTTSTAVSTTAVTSTAVSTTAVTTTATTAVTSTAVSTTAVTSTAVSTTAVTTTVSGSNYTPYYLAVIVILIIVVIAVAVMRRRPAAPAAAATAK